MRRKLALGSFQENTTEGPAINCFFKKKNAKKISGIKTIMGSVKRFVSFIFVLRRQKRRSLLFCVKFHSLSEEDELFPNYLPWQIC